MNIHEFQTQLDQHGYQNSVVTPDPNQEFTQGKYGTLVYRKGDPELEIVAGKTVIAISVSSIEEMSEEHAKAYISRLKRRVK